MSAANAKGGTLCVPDGSREWKIKTERTSEGNPPGSRLACGLITSRAENDCILDSTWTLLANKLDHFPDVYQSFSSPPLTLRMLVYRNNNLSFSVSFFSFSHLLKFIKTQTLKECKMQCKNTHNKCYAILCKIHQRKPKQLLRKICADKFHSCEKYVIFIYS